MADVLEKLQPAARQDPAKRRKHFVYTAEGKNLVLVSIAKTTWGLVLIDGDAITVGQYVKRYRMYPRKSVFDGEHFFWEGLHGPSCLFTAGKSLAPYWTTVKPPEQGFGMLFRGWRAAGGALDVMWDLSELAWTEVPPPPEALVDSAPASVPAF